MIGLGLVVFLVLAAAFAPQLAPYDPNFQHSLGLSESGQPLAPWGHFKLGTDTLGRDELSRLLYGARISLIVGLGANLVAALVGTALGGLAGMTGGWRQMALMRVVDVLLSFPILLLAVAVLAVLRPNLLTIALIIGVSFGAYLARIVFAQVVSLRERDFILAAVTAGSRTPRIFVRHVLPHLVPSVLVFVSLGIATAIQLEAALSYVGVGIQPPRASWGNMLNEGQGYLSAAPWLVVFPGMAIMLAMIGFSLLGDGLRDALDPTLERRWRQVGLGGLR
jgi:peptide/nickel transport system permease protein